mmetsp:Transcript_45530/g.151874  ORF Transcript_45530/g.151874 Transcript_45530/m.151874 type:complete len:202 (-) Transcript_45530:265-870(-)
MESFSKGSVMSSRSCPRLLPVLIFVHSSALPASCRKSVHLSAPSSLYPCSTTCVKIVSSSAALLRRSDFSRSMKQSVDMPRRQPQMTPTVAPPSAHCRDILIFSCSGDRFAGVSCSRAVSVSTTPPKRVPLVSEHTFPRAAAVSVEKPSVTPRVVSIRSPAWIMMMLSMKPNPICAREMDIISEAQFCVAWRFVWLGLARF